MPQGLKQRQVTFEILDLPHNAKKLHFFASKLAYVRKKLYFCVVNAKTY